MFNFFERLDFVSQNFLQFFLWQQQLIISNSNWLANTIERKFNFNIIFCCTKNNTDRTIFTLPALQAVKQ
ncbi:hypothetical protein SAMN05720765_1141 [Fibrobacter sp. UWH6]|nr:hypothetical protein SAMN05720765_1141 [Fibrobacter sp. UWH6]